MPRVKSLVIIFIVSGLFGCSGKSGDSNLLIPTNQSPTADAGSDQSVQMPAVVTLDGSASSDSDGDLLTYAWSFDNVPIGSTITALDDATVVKPTFSPDVAGNYTISLIVNDGLSDSSADTVTITAGLDNVPPVANAGADRGVITGRLVTLNGNGSSDANGDSLTYSWSIVSVAPASTVSALSDPAVVYPSFTPDVDGTYVFSLVVSDGEFTSGADSVTVTAAANAVPVANAGADQTAPKGITVQLDGSLSSDANGDTLTYLWGVTSVPGGSSVSGLVNDTSITPSFTPDIVGDYVFNLTVNDGDVSSTQDTVVITATNTAPVANAGGDQATVSGALVQLSGGNSSDLNGDSITYSWTLTTKPGGSSAALSNSAIVNPTFTADLAGAYVVELIVNDGSLDSAAATVTITAIAGSIYTSADSFPIAIPDASALGITSTITVSGGPVPIANVVVVMDISHPYTADIDIKLEAPNGTMIELTSDNGGAADNYTGTYFSDYVSGNIVDGLPPFTGSYQPEQSLASLNGASANGDWILHVYDDAASDTGTLNDWKIIFLSNTPPKANAGADQIAAVGTTVQLTGALSSDADIDPMTFTWSIISKPVGSTTLLSNTASIIPTFAPDVAGLYKFSLVVNDGTVDSVADEVMLIAATEYTSGDGFPLAIPDVDITGVDSTISVASGPTGLAGIAVLLDITHTYTGDVGIALTSAVGSQITLSNYHGNSGNNYTSTLFSDFSGNPIGAGTAPFTGNFSPDESLSALSGENANGTWTLTVHDQASNDVGTLDDWRLLLFDTVPPIARAGDDTLVTTGNLLQLDGSLSSDGDGDTLSYHWYMTSNADLSKALISNAAIANPTFTPDMDGDYIFTLVVNDGQTDSIADSVHIIATSSVVHDSVDSFPVAVPDNDAASGAQSTISVAGGPSSITSVKVYNVNITHTWVSDLMLTLESPNGTVITLSSANGSDGDNYTNTGFSDSAGQLITAGAAPFTGTFAPEQALSAFNSENANGTWILHVYDTVAGDTGNINGWSLVLE